MFKKKDKSCSGAHTSSMHMSIANIIYEASGTFQTKISAAERAAKHEQSESLEISTTMGKLG